MQGKTLIINSSNEGLHVMEKLMCSKTIAVIQVSSMQLRHVCHDPVVVFKRALGGNYYPSE